MAKARDVVIVAYGRSPLTRANKGSFREMHPVEYGAQTLLGVLAKVENLKPESIEDVIVGCSNPEGATGFNIARLIALRAGLPDSVCGQTLTRFCASGLQAIVSGFNAIAAGQMDVVAAGGIERMTGMSMTYDESILDKELLERVPAAYMPMGFTAENVAALYGISREEMDAFAVESHKKAAAAQAAGKFTQEIVPILVDGPNGPFLAEKDEGIRPDSSLESLAALKPCYKEDGVVTAATSSQMTDGAGFVLLMAREAAEASGIRPIASLAGFAAAGVPSEIMGIGPMKAVPKVMAQTGLTVEDMDVIELNEAFAAQAIPCIRELHLPAEKVNPNGGAIALGHPLGATGAVLTCKALSELRRNGGKYALVTMCIGGGMGAAGIYKMEQ